jgi:hypothetical protein
MVKCHDLNNKFSEIDQQKDFMTYTWRKREREREREN